ncbi:MULTISPECIES: type II toxin-antitoxin system HicA family toxin [Methylomonas]|uniref:Type II toxin-antitoxin system HicA family toxin n=1 Tax=Methylomonas koyamae TaxID=702114 RepID=A0A177PDL4_9GAMM|nr:type II toxin-antitoxin system HicA family toxin [Methylomonas koyamae]OAI28477.1 hypothetical protein A1355_17425 [Methylomonas koyamae]
MSGHHPPLSCAQVKSILKKLGFEPQPQKGTSHEHWKKRENGQLFKVTVDCPKQPFSHDLIRYMARQAGVTVKQFYDALRD